MTDHKDLKEVGYGSIAMGIFMMFLFLFCCIGIPIIGCLGDQRAKQESNYVEEKCSKISVRYNEHYRIKEVCYFCADETIRCIGD